MLFMRGLGPRWVSAPAAGGKNRFGGGVEPLTWAEFSLYQSPSRLYLQGLEVKEDFLSLRSSPSSLLCALRLYRLAAKEAPLDCENDMLLRILWSAMLQLKEKSPPYTVEFRFTWRLLNLMGIAPTFDLCVVCGASLAGGGVFTEEGILCKSCGAQSKLPACSSEELSLLRAAAALPHEKFILWSAGRDEKEFFLKNIRTLSPYFRNMR